MGLETDWGGELALGPSPPLFCISGGLTCVGCFWGARVSLLLPGLGQQEAPARNWRAGREGIRGISPSLPQTALLTAIWSLQLLQPPSDKPSPGVSASRREPLLASISHPMALSSGLS